MAKDTTGSLPERQQRSEVPELWPSSCGHTPGPIAVKKMMSSSEIIAGEMGWVCRLIVLNASDASSCNVQTLDI